MRRLPVCPCQHNGVEFKWTVVGEVGPALGTVQLFRCEDCNRCAYHVPRYGIFFYTDKPKPIDPKTLSWLGGIELALVKARKEAGTEFRSIRIADMPNDVTVFIGRDRTWHCQTDFLPIVVPQEVQRSKFDDQFIHFFLRPPPVCASAYETV